MAILIDGDPAPVSSERPRAGDIGTDVGAITTQWQTSIIYVKDKGHH